MRNHYLVTYDVCDPKRLRAVFHTMRGYGDPLQYSVFVCDLSPKEKTLMIMDLEEYINKAEDRIMIIDLGCSDQDHRENIEVLGSQKPLPVRQAWII